MKLISIGFWANTEDDRWPDVSDFVDHDWDADERHRIVSYLLGGFHAYAMMGPSHCRVCGKLNGSTELMDGTYVWPQGLAHYVQDHGVRLPKEFVDHAIDHQDRIDDAECDDSWWEQVRPE